MNRLDLLLYGLRALWDIITPNVRKVSINEKEQEVILYFYYDYEPTEEEIELSEEAATQVIADLPEANFISCVRTVVRFPEKIDFEGDLIYSRYEKLI